MITFGGVSKLAPNLSYRGHKKKQKTSYNLMVKMLPNNSRITELSECSEQDFSNPVGKAGRASLPSVELGCSARLPSFPGKLQCLGRVFLSGRHGNRWQLHGGGTQVPPSCNCQRFPCRVYRIIRQLNHQQNALCGQVGLTCLSSKRALLVFRLRNAVPIGCRRGIIYRQRRSLGVLKWRVILVKFYMPSTSTRMGT